MDSYIILISEKNTQVVAFAIAVYVSLVGRIDADPDPDTTFQVDADPDSDPDPTQVIHNILDSTCILKFSGKKYSIALHLVDMDTDPGPSSSPYSGSAGPGCGSGS